jgi:hypothetical protein
MMRVLLFALTFYLLGATAMAVDNASCANVPTRPSEADVVALCFKATQDNYIERVKVQQNIEEPYAKSMAPTLELREQGILAQEKTIEKFSSSSQDAIDYLKMKRDQGPQEPDVKKYKIFDSYYNSAEPHDGIDDLKEFGPTLSCGVTGSSTCKDAFSKVINEMNPKDDESLPGALREVLANSAYYKPIANLAIQLFNKYLKVKANPDFNAGDLFQDTMDSFRKSGFSEEASRNAALTFLGVYGSRGASVTPVFKDLRGSNVESPDFGAMISSLGLIGSIISYLDLASLQNKLSKPSGKIYSLPPGVNSSCDYTRPYHFWLAAYLANDLTGEGFSNSAAFQAVSGIEKVYEQHGNLATVTKKSFDAVIGSKDLHNSYNVETQKNIVFNDAGAIWALNSSSKTKSSIQLDFALAEMSLAADQAQSSINNGIVGGVASVLSHVTGAAALGSALQWNSIIQPEAAEKLLIPDLKK